MKKINPANINLGPRKSQPREQTGHQLIIDQQEFQISLDVAEFDNFIRSQGIRVVHYRAIPDPHGMLSRGDPYSANSTTSSSDGFIFSQGGTCQALFTSNNKIYNMQVEGYASASSAFMVFPRTYESGGEIAIHPFDRFYLADVELKVVAIQYVESSSTGIDRLQYPAICVDDLIDAHGVTYKAGTDFEITPEGNIKWITQKRPGWNPTVNKGTVYAIRYRYVPWFVANQLVHEIRLSQVSDPINFERSVARMPYAVHVLRENVFKDVNRDPNRPVNDQRYQDLPPVGGVLGPK